MSLMRLIVLYDIFKGHHIILSRYPVRSIYVSKDKSLSSDDHRNYCGGQLQGVINNNLEILSPGEIASIRLSVESKLIDRI